MIKLFFPSWFRWSHFANNEKKKWSNQCFFQRNFHGIVSVNFFCVLKFWTLLSNFISFILSQFFQSIIFLFLSLSCCVFITVVAVAAADYIAVAIYPLDIWKYCRSCKFIAKNYNIIWQAGTRSRSHSHPLAFIVHSTLMRTDTIHRPNFCPCDITNEHELRQSIKVTCTIYKQQRWTLSLCVQCTSCTLWSRICQNEIRQMECEIMNCLYTPYIGFTTNIDKTKCVCVCICARPMPLFGVAIN